LELKYKSLNVENRGKNIKEMGYMSSALASIVDILD